MFKSAQFKTQRESLGLTTQWIADNLKNKRGAPLALRTVQYWEAGHEYPEDEVDDLLEPIEEWIDDALVDVESHFLALSSQEVIDALTAMDDDDLAVQYIKSIAFLRPVDDAAWRELHLPEWMPQSAYVHFLGLVHQSGALKQMPDVHPLILWASAEDIVQARLGQAELPLELEDEVYGFFIPETRTITLV